MKIKDETKIKGGIEEVRKELEKLLAEFATKDCDCCTLKIRYKAWNRAEKAARKAARADA